MSRPITCPVCGQTETAVNPNTPGIHYRRGTNELCEGSGKPVEPEPDSSSSP